MRFSVLDVAASVVFTFLALIDPSTTSIASQTTLPAQTRSARLQDYVPEGGEGAPNLFAPVRADVSQDISFSQLLTDVDKGNVRAMLAMGLLESETLTGEEIKDLLQGKPPVREACPPSPS